MGENLLCVIFSGSCEDHNHFCGDVIYCVISKTIWILFLSYCTYCHRLIFFSSAVCRHSFNEEADLLTFLQKGASSTSMGSPWKPFLLLSVISGLSGKKFWRRCTDTIVRSCCKEYFLSIGLRRSGTGCSEIHCNEVVNVAQLGESSFMDVSEGLHLFTLGEEGSASLKWLILHFILRKGEDVMAHRALPFLFWGSKIRQGFSEPFQRRSGCKQQAATEKAPVSDEPTFLP